MVKRTVSQKPKKSVKGSPLKNIFISMTLWHPQHYKTRFASNNCVPGLSTWISIRQVSSEPPKLYSFVIKTQNIFIYRRPAHSTNFFNFLLFFPSITLFHVFPHLCNSLVGLLFWSLCPIPPTDLHNKDLLITLRYTLCSKQRNKKMNNPFNGSLLTIYHYHYV